MRLLESEASKIFSPSRTLPKPVSEALDETVETESLSVSNSPTFFGFPYGKFSTKYKFYFYSLIDIVSGASTVLHFSI